MGLTSGGQSVRPKSKKSHADRATSSSRKQSLTNISDNGKESAASSSKQSAAVLERHGSCNLIGFKIIIVFELVVSK